MNLTVSRVLVAVGLCGFLCTAQAKGADKVANDGADSGRADASETANKSTGETAVRDSGKEGPESIVRLKSGAFFRGTIVEMIPNDHVTIHLIDGSNRTEQMSDVAYAGSFLDDPESDSAKAKKSSAKPKHSRTKHAPNSDEVIVRARSGGVRTYTLGTSGGLLFVSVIGLALGLSKDATDT